MTNTEPGGVTSHQQYNLLFVGEAKAAPSEMNQLSFNIIAVVGGIIIPDPIFPVS